MCATSILSQGKFLSPMALTINNVSILLFEAEVFLNMHSLLI